MECLPDPVVYLISSFLMAENFSAIFVLPLINKDWCQKIARSVWPRVKKFHIRRRLEWRPQDVNSPHTVSLSLNGSYSRRLAEANPAQFIDFVLFFMHKAVGMDTIVFEENWNGIYRQDGLHELFTAVRDAMVRKNLNIRRMELHLTPRLTWPTDIPEFSYLFTSLVNCTGPSLRLKLPNSVMLEAVHPDPVIDQALVTVKYLDIALFDCVNGAIFQRLPNLKVFRTGFHWPTNVPMDRIHCRSIIANITRLTRQFFLSYVAKSVLMEMYFDPVDVDVSGMLYAQWADFAEDERMEVILKGRNVSLKKADRVVRFIACRRSVTRYKNGQPRLCLKD
jgi:hypothetical protein